MKIDLMTCLYVFMLAAFIGFEVIRHVSPLLHTPLMSLTNALDSIAVVVIGGTSLLGGEGAIWQTAVGLLIVAIFVVGMLLTR